MKSGRQLHIQGIKRGLLLLIALIFFISVAYQQIKPEPQAPASPSVPQKELAYAFDPKPSNPKPKTKAELQREKESREAFLVAYTVFMHPRCMNCHPNGDTPLQGEDSHLHTQGVTRGPDGKGLYALKCKNCHQDNNIAGLNMPPGQPNWQMPPAHLKMIFQDKSPRQLALHFKESKFTGFKNLEQMIEHVEKEPLVLSCWHPAQGLTTPPISHDEFVAKVKEWIEKGAAIPVN